MNLKLSILMFFCLFFIGSAASASGQKTGKCLLVVDKKTYLSGRCKISTDKDGSFQILNIGKRLTYFAQVQIYDGVANGYWNEEKGANHAHTPLGELKRDGACWVNRQAKVCAWR